MESLVSHVAKHYTSVPFSVKRDTIDLTHYTEDKQILQNLGFCIKEYNHSLFVYKPKYASGLKKIHTRMRRAVYHCEQQNRQKRRREALQKDLRNHYVNLFENYKYQCRHIFRNGFLFGFFVGGFVFQYLTAKT